MEDVDNYKRAMDNHYRIQQSCNSKGQQGSYILIVKAGIHEQTCKLLTGHRYVL